MNNKVLVNILVPKIELEFNLYIPINKKIGTVKKNLVKLLNDETEGNYSEENMILINQDTGLEYTNNQYVYDSKIVNGSTIILI